MRCATCLFVILSLVVGSTWSVIVYNTTCSSRLPKRFNHEERQQLCSQHPQSLAPVACAHVMISNHQSRKNTAQLCQHARSSAPAECFQAVGTSATVGTRIALCSHANTSIPAECWRAVG